MKYVAEVMTMTIEVKEKLKVIRTVLEQIKLLDNEYE